jgi:hypothetical protein
MTRNIVIAASLITFAYAAWCAFNPLRRPEASIQQWVEKATPLGSSLTDVRAIATQRGWYNANIQGSDGHTTGTYIRGELGDYWSIPFVTQVTVFWEFDASNRLVKIRIWKTTNGL